MKKLFILFFALSIIAFAVNSCCKGNSGGKATLIVHIKHHGVSINNKNSYHDSVFVKYNAQEAPGITASNYDAIFVGSGLNDYVTVTGLKCGNYFLYGTAMDSSGPFRVAGGMAFKIKYSERKKSEDIDLAVSE